MASIGDDVKELEEFRREWQQELKDVVDHPLQAHVIVREKERNEKRTSGTGSRLSGDFMVGCVPPGGDGDSDAKFIDNIAATERSPYTCNTSKGASYFRTPAVDSHSDGSQWKRKSGNERCISSDQHETKYTPFSMVDRLLSTAETFKKEGVKFVNSNGKNILISPTSPDNESAPKRRRLQGNTVTDSEIEKTKTDEALESGTQSKVEKDGGLVDILIADLDEINEIPFFDISLPRELAMNIFKHFDIIDLCHCAQVSKSWRSLAEDELIWCMVCHKMGYEKDMVTAGRSDWKGWVKEMYLNDRTLTYNWKNRIGKFSTFEYVQGGVLSAGSSRDQLIVGGYTNCHVSLWDLENDTKCILQPSSTSLVLDEGADDLGAVPNFVSNVAVNKYITAASYNQGLVDVWYNDSGVKPVHSYQFQRPPMTCELCVAEDAPLVAYTCDRHVRLDAAYSGKEFHCVDSIDLGGHVSHLRLVPRHSYSSLDQSNLLVMSTPSYINYHVPGEPRENMTTIHEVAQTHVTCMDAGWDLVACGITYYSSLSNCKIFIYNLDTGQEQATLSGFVGSGTKLVNLADSPRNKLISADFCRRFYIHDLRQSDPVYREAADFLISTIQMDEWKVVCGGEDGQTAVFDQRMGQKLWEFHNRHPVRYSHFQHGHLVTANIPVNHFPEQDDGDQVMMHRRYRGVIQLYNFSVNQDTEGIPSICSSTFDEPIGYNYNINLAMPYDLV